MTLILRKPDGKESAQWAIIELQGDLESRVHNSVHSQFIGDLHFTTNNIPVLIVGHHILYGKEINLEKPFVVLEKQSVKDINLLEKNEPENSCKTEYIVKAIVRKKILFKTRPKPIIGNVPKVV